MLINVAQMLKQVIGTSRTIELEDSAPMDLTECASKYAGVLQLVRTDKGVLVSGMVNINLNMVCSRCLMPFVQVLNFKFSEEYLPMVDILTGLPLPEMNDPEIFTIDDHHQIDLSEALRQYTIVNIPIKPLCKPYCAGLCPLYGKNLNDGKCGCKSAVINPAWALLKDLEVHQ